MQMPSLSAAVFSAVVLSVTAGVGAVLPAHAYAAAAAAEEIVGDPARGEAQAAPCAACHGAGGAAPIDPTYPVIAGQNEKYALRQLELIQSDERPVPVMKPQVAGKSTQELADLAAYFAEQPGSIGQAPDDEERIALAERIYRGGILEKGVAACSSCHSPNGAGNPAAGFPDISGQAPGYTIAQLTQYREGERDTDELYGGMMRDIASKLTDTEIAALADYIHALN